MSNAMSPLPEDHPLIQAFDKYKNTPEYSNTRRWATNPKHTEGSLWAAFIEGWEYSVAYNKSLHLMPNHLNFWQRLDLAIQILFKLSGRTRHK